MHDISSWTKMKHKGLNRHMSEDKRTYYISLVGEGTILSTPKASPWQFKIEADDDEITKLRMIFDSDYDNSINDFWRAHIPFVEYHVDPTNDQKDENLIRAYKMIHRLGDADARQHIEEMGILEDFTSQ